MQRRNHRRPPRQKETRGTVHVFLVEQRPRARLLECDRVPREMGHLLFGQERSVNVDLPRLDSTESFPERLGIGREPSVERPELPRPMHAAENPRGRLLRSLHRGDPVPDHDPGAVTHRRSLPAPDRIPRPARTHAHEARTHGTSRTGAPRPRSTTTKGRVPPMLAGPRPRGIA